MNKIIFVSLIILCTFSMCLAASETTSTLKLSLVIDEIQPVLTLEGSTENNDSSFENADVAFGDLDAGVESITAYFRVSYTDYRWDSSVTVYAVAGDLESESTTTTSSPDFSEPTVENDTMDFSGTPGSAGYFATFDVTWNTSGLATGEYSATVTVTFTVN